MTSSCKSIRLMKESGVWYLYGCFGPSRKDRESGICNRCSLMVDYVADCGKIRHNITGNERTLMDFIKGGIYLKEEEGV